MTYVIKSRKYGYVYFWMDDGGGYVYRTFPDKPGCTGRQICYGGDYVGDTVTAHSSNFIHECRLWWRSFMRRRRVWGEDFA